MKEYHKVKSKSTRINAEDYEPEVIPRHESTFENFLYQDDDINPLDEDAKEQEIEEK